MSAAVAAAFAFSGFRATTTAASDAILDRAPEKQLPPPPPNKKKNIVIMAGSRDRTRERDGISLADCPFSVRQIDTKKSWQKKRKQGRTNDDADNGDDDILVHVSPFRLSAVSGSFKTMDIRYKVEPAKWWSEMTRYNSFVCMKPSSRHDELTYKALTQLVSVNACKFELWIKRECTLILARPKSGGGLGCVSNSAGGPQR
ncbi:hypothetical protein F5883DRAFT_49121 [Diaporthe sp. PMI_573]|nr:hypothetical protein F5883DRAFT_49121 [Diaporthaceae sp. PMI_573]